MIFEDLGLNTNLFKTIKEMGFSKPTQIQEKSIPFIMQGKDVVGESETGSGKTLAFGAGIIEKVVPKEGLQALVLTPTRELAEQVMKAIDQFSSGNSLRTASVYGGVSITNQIHELTRAEVVVATPGRLLDHLQRRTIDLSKIRILVLDEADRMLDMGFVDDVERIVRSCPRERQTMFFSATIDSRIKSLANKYMVSPEIIMAGKQVDPSKLKQVYYDVTKNMKLSMLVHLLKEEKSGLAMVFCNTRMNTDFVVKNLKANKIDAIAIHGGFTQNKRSRSLDFFNRAKFGVLVCTDVAARGLHIDNVSHVYNYEIPSDSKDYVHRIGRTARAGEAGKVINLLCEFDYDNFRRIQRDYSELSVEKMEKPHVERVIAIRVESSYGKKPFRSRKKTWRKR
ncbi:DEAD/DEAH box helicase [Candidatus Woesearchaeota archaeon]|jgi:ATP-dependent RNA helicase DeaD|nr:DEAD/DEAH box helicase [Candidatus Woesearchaeota archaeon]MBT4321992.1 DEAD/DEAH box helicase [Candidatus Woesearchaeota archaeon]MBT4630738.1 DEAD/DEAH box helicase [Candidatus Woesearchaeota archaeon]